jgi:menaquinone-dependent protoporphyrinogen oxidase
MRVLVGAASRHGSTAEIAARIAAILDRGPQIAVVVAASAEVDSLEGFEAYVIGSAAYVGRWLTEARELGHRRTAGPTIRCGCSPPWAADIAAALTT